jgi:hypothetical protein
MPYLSRKQRLVIALGGFIFFAGFLTLVLTILVATGVTETENILQFVLFKEILAVVGVLNLLAGVLLFLSK